MNVLDDIEEKDSLVTATFVSFNKWLNNFNNIDELINTSPYLIEHHFYLKDLLLQSKYLVGEEIEVVISKMQNTGSKSWQRLYMELSSTILMDIDIQGESKKVSLSELRNMSYEESASLRKAAYYAEADACRSIAQASAACINGISGEALTIYDMRGYKSPLEKVLMVSRMDYKTSDAMFSAIKESRIMANFTGNFGDIGVLAHEIGHAYHSYCLRNEKMLNTEYPIPIAETASIFSETIVNNALLNIVPSNESLSILEKSISDVGYYIVDFYGRYLFENKLYERRKSGPLSVEELNELMSNCMIEAYGDSIDAETIHPYMWMNKIGYFMTGNEFLNFPYSFGVLFSKGLYAEYIKKGDTFVSKYNNFLSVKSKNNIVDIAKIINVDVHSIEFWRNALNLIEKDIEEFISRV